MENSFFQKIKDFIINHRIACIGISSGAVLLIALAVVLSHNTSSGEIPEKTFEQYTSEEVSEENISETVSAKETDTKESQYETEQAPGTPEFKELSFSHTIPGSVPMSQRVDASFFDDAVFVGDSVSLKLNYYETSYNVLGTCEFLTAGSFSAICALEDITDVSAHPSYRGTKMKVEDAVRLMGKKKVYIMLGMNDIGRSSIDDSVKRMETLCDRILIKSPDVSIYIESMTPLAKESNRRSAEGLNNNRIHEYNQKLCLLCQKRGWKFINVSEVLYDSENNLRRDYCSDYGGMGMHFTNSGCSAWVQYLYEHSGVGTPIPQPDTEPQTKEDPITEPETKEQETKTEEKETETQTKETPTETQTRETETQTETQTRETETQTEEKTTGENS